MAAAASTNQMDQYGPDLLFLFGFIVLETVSLAAVATRKRGYDLGSTITRGAIFVLLGILTLFALPDTTGTGRLSITTAWLSFFGGALVQLGFYKRGGECSNCGKKHIGPCDQGGSSGNGENCFV